MNQAIKNSLGVVIMLVLLALSYISFQYVDSYSRSTAPSTYRSFSVAAQGESVATADIAKFTFSVISEGEDLSELQEENTENSNRVITFLKKEGILDKDIKTTQYGIDPRYQYFECRSRVCPPPEIVGYSIRNTVSVKIRDFEALGTLLSGTVDNGANSVSQFSFTIDDRTEVENEARKDAMKKAERKAEALAEAGGFRVGDILSVSEEGGYNPPPMPYRLEMAVSSDASFKEAPILEPGSEDVTIRVVVTYEIR